MTDSDMSDDSGYGYSYVYGSPAQRAADSV